jgi:hypothetical protein
VRETGRGDGVLPGSQDEGIGWNAGDIGVFRTDPARPRAYSCKLRSAASPVPNCEGPGPPAGLAKRG